MCRHKIYIKLKCKKKFFKCKTTLLMELKKKKSYIGTRVCVFESERE